MDCKQYALHCFSFFFFEVFFPMILIYIFRDGIVLRKILDTGKMRRHFYPHDIYSILIVA